MKHLRKFMAFIISIVMTISTMGTLPAFAAEGAPADESISVSNLAEGDKVNFYKVLQFDETATDTGGWVAASGFTGLSKAEIQKILRLDANGKPVNTTAEGYDVKAWGIDSELAGKIALMAEADGVNPKFAGIEASSEGIASQATTAVGDAGLYVALIDPVTIGELYNPIFVGADYTAGGTNTQSAVITLSYANEALAKKEDVTLTKEIDDTVVDVNATDDEKDTKYDINVGDEVSFTITSKVPAYSSAYQNPTYVITDTMEDGLILSSLPVVTIAGITAEEGKTYYNINPSAVSEEQNIRQFSVTLTQDGLQAVANTGQAQNITVTYNARVKSVENATVTEKENEATVKFSNNPDDSTSYSLLEDKTRTYTFTIDGNLLGKTGTSYETDELIKVGLNADGTPATEEKTYHSETEFKELSPLEGAEFALFKQEPGADDYKSKTAAIDSGKLYTNTKFTTGFVISDANGRLKIEGLDEGTYYLREVSAPTGYIADNRTFIITINASYTEIPSGSYTNTQGKVVKYDAYKVLDGYTVTVNDGTGNNVSTYNIVNTSDGTGTSDHHLVVDKATFTQITGFGDWAGDNVTPISNTKGTELPSTGGIGTTIFYIVGGGMVVGAVVFLLTKRRVAGNE
jgi:fimbrial isopeptide formation D2 family protein/LPXTG-motif cell wall-anchored protein